MPCCAASAGQVQINAMNVQTRIVPLRVSLAAALITSACSAHASFTISYGSLPAAPAVQQRVDSQIQMRELPAQTDVAVPASHQSNHTKVVRNEMTTPAESAGTVAKKVYAPALQNEVEVVITERAKRVDAPHSAYMAATAAEPTAPTRIAAPAPAPAPSPAPAAKDQPDEIIELAPPVETWIVSPVDGTLRVVLNKWASQSGWQISWEASVDLPLTVSAEFYGDFKSAVKQLFTSLSASDVNLNALLYTGNKVLRVTEVGRRAK